MPLRSLLVLLLGLTCAQWLPAVEIGDSRAAVLNEIGPPSSTARRNQREILVYPKGGRIELVEGKVVDIRGPLPVGQPAEPPPVAPAPSALASPTPPPAGPPPGAPAAAPKAVNTKPTPGGTSTAAPVSFNPADAANALGDKVEKMNTAWGALPPPPKKHSALDNIPSFLVGLLLRFTLTIVGLKLAFKYWEMDAFWTGVCCIAGIDVALHAILELLGPATGGLTTMNAVENGLPGLALIFTINYFCINKRLQNAVVTAMTVKLAVTICYLFLGVWLLQMAFG
ncbi:MAG TPA: hypothetical protein VMC06_02855 [Opitutaceae bacterium]|nr:hypothetical protein [Opitutaceae bacterium]